MPKKIRLPFAVAALGVGALLLACGLDKATPAGTPAPSVWTEPAAPAPKPSYHAPAASDFQLEIKILEKSCFGSAGCNITYRVDMVYRGAGPLNPNVTYEVTYEIRGAEDPKISTMTVTGDQYRREERDLVQTPSKNSVLTAVVTAVGS